MFYMILLLVAIFAIIVYKRFRKQDEVKKIESDADKELNEMDFEKLFFERTISRIVLCCAVFFSLRGFRLTLKASI